MTATTTGEQHSAYAYNAEGVRVRQRVQQGGVMTTTLYVGENVELRGDRLILYLFDDEDRISDEGSTDRRNGGLNP